MEMIGLALLYIMLSSQATVKMPFTVSSVSSKVLARANVIRRPFSSPIDHYTQLSSRSSRQWHRPQRDLFHRRFARAAALPITFIIDVSRISGFRGSSVLRTHSSHFVSSSSSAAPMLRRSRSATSASPYFFRSSIIRSGYRSAASFLVITF